MDQITANPLLDAFESRDRMPDDLPGMGGMRFGAGVSEFYLRDAMCRKYAWGIPTQEALAKVESYSPLVEIGAGTGYWAALLAARGADVIAYDSHPPGGLAGPAMFRNDGPRGNGWGHRDCYFPVQQGGPEKIALHPERTLFVCWPPHNGGPEFLGECLARYRRGVLVYVGEHDGCTSWDVGFERDWEEVESVDLPQWSGIHDYLMILRRK